MRDARAEGVASEDLVVVAEDDAVADAVAEAVTEGHEEEVTQAVIEAAADAEADEVAEPVPLAVAVAVADAMEEREADGVGTPSPRNTHAAAASSQTKPSSQTDGASAVVLGAQGETPDAGVQPTTDSKPGPQTIPSVTAAGTHSAPAPPALSWNPGSHCATGRGATSTPKASTS